MKTPSSPRMNQTLQYITYLPADPVAKDPDSESPRRDRTHSTNLPIPRVYKEIFVKFLAATLGIDVVLSKHR
jgi:hypothetical protein